MFQTGAHLCVVQRQRGRVAEPFGELELMSQEGRVLAQPVDVERPFERSAGDQRHDDHGLWFDGGARQELDARIEVRLVRPYRLSLLDSPAGDSLPEARPEAHDLVLVRI